MKMNKTSRRIIKSLLASAVLSLFHSESKAEVPILPSLDDLGNSNAEELDIMKQKVFKHVIKLKPDGTMIGVEVIVPTARTVPTVHTVQAEAGIVRIIQVPTIQVRIIQVARELQADCILRLNLLLRRTRPIHLATVH